MAAAATSLILTRQAIALPSIPDSAPNAPSFFLVLAQVRMQTAFLLRRVPPHLPRDVPFGSRAGHVRCAHCDFAARTFWPRQVLSARLSPFPDKAECGRPPGGMSLGANRAPKQREIVSAPLVPCPRARAVVPTVHSYKPSPVRSRYPCEILLPLFRGPVNAHRPDRD